MHNPHNCVNTYFPYSLEISDVSSCCGYKFKFSFEIIVDVTCGEKRLQDFGERPIFTFKMSISNGLNLDEQHKITLDPNLLLGA